MSNIDIYIYLKHSSMKIVPICKCSLQSYLQIYCNYK